MADWKPFNTAPQDGTYILIAGGNFDGGMAVVQWDKYLGWWTLDDGKNPEIMMRHESAVTHWMPLPVPPSVEQAPEEPLG